MTQEQILNAKLECLKIALTMNPHGDINKLIEYYNILILQIGLGSC